MSVTNHRFSNIWDKVGIGLSLLCLLHCLMLPLVILSLPMMARFYLGNALVHLGLALIILPVGLMSFIKGYLHHRSLRPLTIGAGALMIIALAPFAVHVLGWNLPEASMMIFGSITLIVAHLMNRRSCHRCDLDSKT